MDPHVVQDVHIFFGFKELVGIALSLLVFLIGSVWALLHQTSFKPLDALRADLHAIRENLESMALKFIAETEKNRRLFMEINDIKKRVTTLEEVQNARGLRAAKSKVSNTKKRRGR